jgi:hypothetical protein
MVSVDHGARAGSAVSRTGRTGMHADHTEPIDVVDRLLWRDAQHMLGRHAEPDNTGRCVWCGWDWPCPPRRLAERAEEASYRPWRESWTARHDLNGIRALPSWRDALGERSAAVQPGAMGSNRRLGRSRANRGLFD